MSKKMNKTTEPLTHRMEADWAELAERMMRAVPRDGTRDVQPGLGISRFSHPTELHHGLFEPCLFVTVQGAKAVTLGDEGFRYDEANFMIATVGVPMTAQVVEASPERP